MKTPKILRFAALALAVLIGLGPTTVMAQRAGGAGAYQFWWAVTDERGEAYTGENVQCSVYRPNQHAAAIIHTTSLLTSGNNSPLFSDVNGKFHFFTSTDTPVDVSCFYAHGGDAYVNRLRTTDHKIVVPRQSSMKISRFAVNSTAATYQTDSGISLPGGALIHDVIIQNLNPQGLGTYHLSIGFLGNHTVANAAALVHTQALSSPDEWLRPHVQYSFTQQILGVAANHRGLVLSDFALRHSEGAGSRGWYVERPYLIHVSTGLTIGYSAQPGTGPGLRVHVHVIWQRFHVGINRLGRTN